MKCKAIVCFFLLCLCIQLLTGCSKNGGGTEDKEGKGRYIESQLDIPKENDQTEIVLQDQSQDGSIVIYTEDCSNPDKISLTKYHYDNSKEALTSETPQWLQSVPVSGSAYKVQVLQGAENTEYLFVADNSGGTLYKTTDGKESVKLNMEGWDASESDGQNTIYPESIGLLDNGGIVVAATSGYYLYDGQSGKQKQKIVDQCLADVLAVAGNRFVVISDGDDGEEVMKSLAIYDAQNLDDAPEVVKFDTPIPLETTVSLNNSGDLIIANTEGIHVLTQGTDTWQTVVDGSLNTMYIPNINCDSVLQDEKDNYYILYKNMFTNESSIMQYRFDEKANSVPRHELTIYTLEDRPLLRAAANAFQKTHQDYKVSIQVAMTADSTLTKADYIRSLNTQLLSGSGCDLLILDGLPLDSYIEKGVLSDLSSIIDPMLKNKELFSNVVIDYYSKDKIYALPARIKIPLIYGRADVIKACSTLDNMAAYAKDNKANSLLGAFTYEDIISEFLPCYMHDIMTADKKISTGGLKKFLEDIKIILDSTGYIESYSEDHWKPSFDELPVKTSIYKDSATNLCTMGIVLSFAHAVEGDFTTFENSYEPANTIGINKSSKQQKAAKEFVECMLSDEVQMQDIEWAGLPINVKAFEKTKIPKWWSGDEPILYEDGKEGYVTLSDISEADKKKMIGYCSTVTERVYMDDNILHAIMELGKNYILGDEAVDKTVSLIQNKLSIYSEE